MTTFQLKLIACFCMLIDHVTLVFLPRHQYIWNIDTAAVSAETTRDVLLYTIGRGIGRIAFPIFCFILVEGFIHTRNLKKYYIRLLLAALASEIPFNMMLKGVVFDRGSQNVLFTLLLGLGAITVAQMARQKWKEDYTLQVIVVCVAFVLFGLLAQLLSTDYSMFGVLLVVVLYLFREKRVLALFATALLVFLLSDMVSMFEMFGLLAFPLLFFYNGKKGRNDRYVLYAFYPVHLLILGLLRMFG